MKIITAFVFAVAATVSLSAAALTSADQYGSKAATNAAQKTISIDSRTHYINVEQGDTVTLTDGSHTMAWQFDGIERDFPLAKVFPEANNADAVTVYVKPEYRGGH